MLDRFTKTLFWNWDLGCGFFLLGPIETTKKMAKNGQKKLAKNGQKKIGQKFLVFCYRDLALAVSVVLPPWEAFFDFLFPSYGRFREGTPPTSQNDKMTKLGVQVKKNPQPKSQFQKNCFCETVYCTYSES